MSGHADILRSDHCDIHRFFSVHLLYSRTIQSILIEPIRWYLRWSHSAVPALLHDYQDRKPASTPDLSTSDLTADDLLLPR